MLAIDAIGAQLQHLVLGLGGSLTACIGNGRNDSLMLREAILAIAVIQTEGACSQTVQAAHVVTTDVTHAVDLLRNPRRLLATLRP